MELNTPIKSLKIIWLYNLKPLSTMVNIETHCPKCEKKWEDCQCRFVECPFCKSPRDKCACGSHPDHFGGHTDIVESFEQLAYVIVLLVVLTLLLKFFT